MEILVKTSSRLTQPEWVSYVFGFNEVFNKVETVEDFKHKYLNTIDNNSYHSLLYDGIEIVGGCTVIPYHYNINGSIERVGLAVDVFIRNQFRTDIFALFRMYKNLKEVLINQGVVLVIAVPNEVSYPYWKKIVKWKDIGLLNYYALPVKAGNVLKKAKYPMNFLSYYCSMLMLIITYFTNFKERILPIRIDRSNSILEKQRYTRVHTIIKDSISFFSYRILNEKGLNACYLIDFYNMSSSKKDSISLYKAIKHILKREQVDIIIFVGKLNFFQFLLPKVPYKSEPKHLNFTADVLIPEKISDPKILFNINSWDFGLFNYDVR